MRDPSYPEDAADLIVDALRQGLTLGYDNREEGWRLSAVGDAFVHVFFDQYTGEESHRTSYAADALRAQLVAGLRLAAPPAGALGREGHVAAALAHLGFRSLPEYARATRGGPA